MLGPDFQHYSPVETYFVDFLREPPEPTGDEPEDFVLEAPKIYEEIPRYIDRYFIFNALDQKAKLR
jgi:dynein heavy chain